MLSIMSSAWIQQHLKRPHLEEDIAKAKHLGFDHLCTGCYRVSLAIFISPFDACFSLLTASVHSFAAWQAILIFQQAVALGWGFSSLSHIIISAFSSLVDSWQMTILLSQVFFVIVDWHFVTLSPLCIGSLVVYLLIVCFCFSLGCVYSCFLSPSSFAGWVPILNLFIFTRFFFYLGRNFVIAPNARI